MHGSSCFAIGSSQWQWGIMGFGGSDACLQSVANPCMQDLFQDQDRIIGIEGCNPLGPLHGPCTYTSAIHKYYPVCYCAIGVMRLVCGSVCPATILGRLRD